MTEATCNISVNPIEGERKIGSVGIPLPYTKIKIIKENAKGSLLECKTGESGEICVANPGVVAGNTYTDPEKNKDMYYKKDFFRTGDLGYVDEDGYLFITGRAKDLIIRGGHNIDPAIAEEALASHPAVAMIPLDRIVQGTPFHPFFPRYTLGFFSVSPMNLYLV